MKIILILAAIFNLCEISSRRPFDPAFETRALTPSEQQEILLALNQPYTYYGCGGQSFVFFSADGNYALKFFKQSRYRPPKFSFRSSKALKRKERLQREYGSYKLAFETLPEETGLLYIHFNPTSHLLPTLTPQGIELDSADFILQRRATLLFDALDRSSPEEAKNILTNVVHLITICHAKKCYDKDPKLSDNCGVINGRAVKIDAGRLLFNAPQRPLKAVLQRHLHPLHMWLAKHHPELIAHLEKLTEQALKDK